MLAAVLLMLLAVLGSGWGGKGGALFPSRAFQPELTAEAPATLHEQRYPVPQALQVLATMSDSPYIFDGPDADVILRAPLQPESDEFKDFHVHKLILSIASSVFRDILSIPQPPRHTSEDTTLDVIKVTEPAGVLRAFLELIYPVDPPVIEYLWLVDDLFRLADKYAAKGVSGRLKKFLVSPSFLADNPIGVFAIACRNNLHEEEKLALFHTFSIDVVGEITLGHLESMTTTTYHRLLAKHALRQEQLVDAVDQAALHMMGSLGSCDCIEELKKEIRLVTPRRPFLDREILDACFASVRDRGSRSCSTRICICTPVRAARFPSDIMRAIQAIPM